MNRGLGAIRHSAPRCPVRLPTRTGPVSGACLFSNGLFFQRPCLQLPPRWPHYRTGQRRRGGRGEPWLAQTGARPPRDEFAGSRRRARYEGSGSSSHLRLNQNQTGKKDMYMLPPARGSPSRATPFEPSLCVKKKKKSKRRNLKRRPSWRNSSTLRRLRGDKPHQHADDPPFRTTSTAPLTETNRLLLNSVSFFPFGEISKLQV